MLWPIHVFRAEPAGGRISFDEDLEEVITLELSELIDPRLMPR